MAHPENTSQAMAHPENTSQAMAHPLLAVPPLLFSSLPLVLIPFPVIHSKS